MTNGKIDKAIAAFMKPKLKHAPNYLSWNKIIPVYKKVREHWGSSHNNSLYRWALIKQALINADLIDLRKALHDYIINIKS